MFTKPLFAPTSVRARVAAILGVFALMFAYAVTVAAPTAWAASPNVVVTKLVKSDVNGNEQSGALRVDDVAKLSFTWNAPTGKPSQGDSFSIGLPGEFANLEAPQTRPLEVTHNGAQVKVGECELTSQGITCTFNEKVDELHRQGFKQWSGAGEALLKVTAEHRQEESSFILNETPTNVDLPGTGGIGPKAKAIYVKEGFTKVATPLTRTSKLLQWETRLNTAFLKEELAKVGTNLVLDKQTRTKLVFTDVLGPGQKFNEDPNTWRFGIRNHAGEPEMSAIALTQSDGKDLNTNYGDFDLKVEISGDPSEGQRATITVEGPFWPDTNYRLWYQSIPTTDDSQVVPGFKYTNELSLQQLRAKGERYYSDSFTVSVNYLPNFGGFDITKLAGGDGATLIPADTSYQVQVDYTLPGGATIDTYADQNWQAPGTPKADKTGGTATFAVTLGKKTTFQGQFPVGTIVRLSEDPATASNAPSGYKYGQPTFSTSELTIENGKSIGVELTNDATQQRGRFTVAKTAQGATVPADKDFTFNYTCGTQQGTLKAKAGGPAVASPLFPAGTKCTITEDEAAAQLADHTLALPAAQTVTIGADPAQPIAVTFDNVYTIKTGKFSVAKSVLGAQAPADRDFAFNYVCGGQQGTLNVRAGGPAVESPEFPLGTECSITEVEASAQLDGYNLTAPAAQTVTIREAGVTVPLVFQNRYALKVGRFSVAKSVEGGDFAADSFRFKYVCGADSGVLTVPGDGSVVESPALPDGVVCTLSEDAASAAREGYSVTSTLSADTVTITDGGVAAVTARNVYTRDKGTFEVVKVVAGDGVGLFETDTFDVAYTCNDADKTAGVLRVPGNGTAVAGPEVPTGTECQLEESEATRARDGYSVAAAFDAPNVRVVKDNPARATLTNTYTQLKGSFSVAKSVAGDGAVVAGNEFVFDYSCVDGAAKKTVADSVTVTAGGPAVSVTDVPVGKCVVTERDASVAGATLETKLSVDGAEKVGPSVEFPVADGATVEVSAVNTYTLERGQFSVAKTVSGDGASEHAKRSFVFDYVCDTVEGEKRGDVSVPGDGSVVTVGERLPMGASCVVTERADSAQAAGFDVTVPEAKTVKVGAAGEVVALAFDNAYVRHTGSFAISKKVAGHPGLAGHEFKFEYVCGDVTGSLLVKGDGVAVPAGVAVPTGTTCKVSEVEASAQVSGWDVKVPAGQEFVVADKGQVVEVSFVNEYTEQPKASPSPSVSVTPGPSVGPSQGPSGSPSAAPGGKLAKTGVDALGLGLFAGAVLAGGVALVGLSRRRAAR